jgi:hypothetical protein
MAFFVRNGGDDGALARGEKRAVHDAGPTVEGAPLYPALDRRCFTCPAQRQRVEGLAGLDQNRWVDVAGIGTF